MELQNELFEDQIQQQAHSLAASFRPAALWAGLRRRFMQADLQTRVLYGLGAGVVVYILVRSLLGGRSRRILPMQSPDGHVQAVVVEAEAPGFWTQLLQRAVQTFLLTYARKRLTAFLESKSAPTTPAHDASQPAGRP
jgi:hypothetical protein